MNVFLRIESKTTGNPMSRFKPMSPKIASGLKSLAEKFSAMFSHEYVVRRYVSTNRGMKRM